MYYITINFTFFNIYDIVNLNIFNTFLTMLNNFYFNLFILLYFSLCFINIQKSNKLFIILFLFLISTSIKYKYILSNFFFGFYKIHPPLLYIVLMFFFYSIIKRNKIIKHNYQKVFNLIVLTFIWGSLWALTQSIWSKYWSNDSIEIILLLMIVIIFIKIHSIYNYQSKFNNFLMLIIFNLLILLRLNFIFTKHNFFQKVINFQNYLYIIYFIIYINFFKKIKSQKYLNSLNLLKLTVIYITFEIILNIINWHFIKKFNSYFYNILLLSLYIYITNILNKFFFLHISYLIVLIIFNNFYVNYINTTDLFLYIKNTTSQNTFFFFKKKINFWIWKKNLFLNKVQHHNILFKKFNFFSKLNNLQTKLINFY